MWVQEGSTGTNKPRKKDVSILGKRSDGLMEGKDVGDIMQNSKAYENSEMKKGGHGSAEGILVRNLNKNISAASEGADRAQ